jgi:hypothetical protein
MATYAKPYLSGLRLNLHEFVAKQQGYNQQGVQVTAYGKQRRSLSVDFDLYLGDKNVGRQTYTFADKAQPATDSHLGLPAHSDVIPTAISDQWTEKIGEVVDLEFPAFSDESPESKKSGPAIHPRINRIEASLPFERPAERYIAAVVGLYEDSQFTRQITEADLLILFVQDDFIIRQLQGAEPTPEQMATFRSQNNQYSLKDFVANPIVTESIGALAMSVFTVLKSQVRQWADIDVQTIMSRFTIPVE